MQPLFILLSILLLSSPLIGNNHKGEILYLWKTSSGLVWKGFGDKETHPKYEVDNENGKPNGVGFLTSPSGVKYIGEWKDRFVNGQGTYTSQDGTIGKVEFKDNTPWNISLYGKYKNFTGKYVNKVKQK